MGVFLRYPLHVLKGKKCEPLFLTGNLTPVALASALIVSRYSEGVVYLQGARDQRVWCGRPRERKHVACERLAPHVCMAARERKHHAGNTEGGAAVCTANHVGGLRG